MQRLIDIFRRACGGSAEAKNPLTAGAAEKRDWTFDDASMTLESDHVRGQIVTCKDCCARKTPRQLASLFRAGVFFHHDRTSKRAERAKRIRQHRTLQHVSRTSSDVG